MLEFIKKYFEIAIYYIAEITMYSSYTFKI